MGMRTPPSPARDGIADAGIGTALEELRESVGDRLAAFVGRQADSFNGLGRDLAPLMDALTDLSGTGKRLRAAFCYWGWRGVPGHDPAHEDGVLSATVALELLQA